jgi:hypothetical protein
MERYETLLEQAKNKFKSADYILHQTYPVIQEPKLLLTIAENLLGAVHLAISSLLQHERQYKRVPPVTESLIGQLPVFERCVTRYKLEKKYVDIAKELHEIITAHQKSPVEFRRKDQFVICYEDYKIKTVTLEELKQHVDIARSLLEDVTKLISTNELTTRQN